MFLKAGGGGFAGFVLAEKNLKASLWLVGSGGRLDHYQQLVISRGLKNVKFWGQIPREKVLELISMAEVCVIPFIAKRFCLTACPLKVVEYMSKNKKIVASDLPGIIEILDGSRNSFIFQAGKKEDLLESLENSLRTKTTADDSAILARSRDQAIQNLSIIYQQLTKDAR